jgi:hypothetical protein
VDGMCPMESFSISGVGPSGSAATVLELRQICLASR